MIWIANHNIKGQSDNLRLPLSLEIDSIETHDADPEGSPAVVNGSGPWTGVGIDSSYDDMRSGFEAALGSQIVFADQVDSTKQGFETMAEELEARYSGDSE